MSGSEETGALGRLARRSGSWSFGLRLLVLTAVVVVAYPVLAGVATARRGSSTWQSAALAAAICWFGALLALVFSDWLRGPQAAHYALLLGLLVRTGCPLTAVVIAIRTSSRLEAVGFVGLVLGFYFVTLVTETLLTLSQVSSGPGVAKVR